MLLVVPNGKVKLLNALPFAPADLRRQSLAEAWLAYRDAWRSDEVRDFVRRCRAEPALLRHANETQALGHAGGIQPLGTDRRAPPTDKENGNAPVPVFHVAARAVAIDRLIFWPALSLPAPWRALRPPCPAPRQGSPSLLRRRVPSEA